MDVKIPETFLEQNQTDVECDGKLQTPRADISGGDLTRITDSEGTVIPVDFHFVLSHDQCATLIHDLQQYMLAYTSDQIKAQNDWVYDKAQPPSGRLPSPRPEKPIYVSPWIEDDVGRATTPKPEESPIPGQIYLIRNGDVYKIGRSKDVQKRLKQFRTVIPGAELIHQFPADNVIVVEDLLHQFHENTRVEREWFALSERQVDVMCSITEYCETKFRLVRSGVAL
jgi:hypothetical protein